MMCCAKNRRCESSGVTSPLVIAATPPMLVLRDLKGDVTRDDSQRRFLAQNPLCNIVATLFRIVIRFSQYYNDGLCEKSSLRIDQCNITLSHWALLTICHTITWEWEWLWLFYSAVFSRCTGSLTDQKTDPASSLLWCVTLASANRKPTTHSIATRTCVSVYTWDTPCPR